MINRYPLWKKGLLIICFLFSVFYTLPNLFPEQPTVQISPPPGSHENLAQFTRRVVQILKRAQLEPLASRLAYQALLLSFRDIDTQLKAKDSLQAVLGDDYTIAVNLMPVLPNWLRNIGATPMKLGLDLRGGVHFTLELDINSLLTQRLESLIPNLSEYLRQINVRYLSLEQQPKYVLINFQTAEQLKTADRILKRRFPTLQFELQQAHNNYRLMVGWTASGLQAMQQQAIEQTMHTLRNRINALGVAESIVQQQGSTRISVDLPGIQDIGRAQQILGGTATIEFHLVDTSHNPHMAQAGLIPAGLRLYHYQGQPVLLNKTVVLTGTAITNATLGFDDRGRAAVDISLGGSAASHFYHVTQANIGRPLATVYAETRQITQTVNGRVLRIPHKSKRVVNIAIINSALSTNFQIQGLSNPQEALDLALLLRAGALPAPIYIVEQSTIGPQLGAENIRMGMFSIALGFSLAVVFMGIYYHVFGLIADLALAANLLLLVALLSLLGMTLTLPGMAGIVLTVGIAVDANVLIFERIREELRRGASALASIQTGYAHALVTIVDANVTTLIASIALFSIGTGSIRGFAVVLILGIVTSLLTGVGFTRVLVDGLYGGRRRKNLPIGI